MGRTLTASGVPVAAVNTLSDVLESPQFRARGLFAQLRGICYVAQPMRFSGDTIAPAAGPPALGEHTNAILAELEAAQMIDPSVADGLRAPENQHRTSG